MVNDNEARDRHNADAPAPDPDQVGGVAGWDHQTVIEHVDLGVEGGRFTVRVGLAIDFGPDMVAAFAAVSATTLTQLRGPVEAIILHDRGGGSGPMRRLVRAAAPLDALGEDARIGGAFVPPEVFLELHEALAPFVALPVLEFPDEEGGDRASD